MAHTFFCEKCGKRFDVDEAMIGRRAKCKDCQHVFVIPDRGSTAPAPPPGPRPGDPISGRSPAAAPRPRSVPPPGDPYGLDEATAAPFPPRHVPAADHDEEFLPPRPGRPVSMVKRKSQRPSAPELRWLGPLTVWGLGTGLLLALLGVALALVKFPTPSVILLGLTAVVCLLMWFTAGIVGICLPFYEDITQGLLCLFVPFYRLFYLITRWDFMKRQFFLSLSTFFLLFVLVGSGAIILPALATTRQGAMVSKAGGVGTGFATIPARSEGEHEKLTKEVIAKFNELADLLAGINSAEDARRDAGHYAALADELTQLQQRIGAMPAPGPAVDKRLSNLYGAAFNQANQRYLKEIGRVAGIEGVPAILALRNYPFNRLSPQLAVVSGKQGQSKHPARQPKVRPSTPAPDEPTTEEPERPIARRNQAAPRPRDNQPANGDFVDQALEDLKSSEPPARKRALGRLTHARPNDRRAEVAAVIEPLLDDPNSFTRADAAKALGIWGGPANTPALVAALDDPEFNVRWALLDALKALKDPQSAQALAKLLPAKDRGKVCDALKAIGPEAEEAVLPYLRHDDGFVRMDTCKVLQAIGTEKSVPDLRVIAMRQSGLDSMAARDALQQMARRNVNINVTSKKKTRGR